MSYNTEMDGRMEDAGWWGTGKNFPEYGLYRSVTLLLPRTDCTE